MIWKVEAQGDTVYVEADDFDKAETKFFNAFGNIPPRLITWTKIDELPEGEETIAG